MDRETFGSSFRSVFTGPGPAGARAPGVRVFQTVASQPSWVVRSALMAAAAVLVAIMLVIIVPVVLVAVAVFVAGMMVTRVRRWLEGMRRPNGMLDGRKNVRVIVRQGE